jgi:hypothetical protein
MDNIHFNYKHGHCLNYNHSKTYSVWRAIVSRCNNKNNKTFINKKYLTKFNSQINIYHSIFFLII